VNNNTGLLVNNRSDIFLYTKELEFNDWYDAGHFRQVTLLLLDCYTEMSTAHATECSPELGPVSPSIYLLV